MDWIEIKISVASSDVEAAGDIANMTVPYGIYIEDYSDLEQGVKEIAHIDLIDEELLRKDRTQAYVHIYINPEDNPAEAIAFLSEKYREAGIGFTIETSSCKDEDWINNWRQYFCPIEVGAKLLIRPSWRKNYDPKGRTVIDIDPGLAFGTGGHETTRLCLAVLEKYIKGGESVLDIGTGSGILGIASVKLGARSAVGTDIDETAVKVANENARLNSVQDKFFAVQGDLAKKINGKFDIILANLVADTVIALSRSIKPFMKNSSVYIMSGIIDTRADEVIAKISEDFILTETHTDKGWYCLAAKAKDAHPKQS